MYAIKYIFNGGGGHILPFPPPPVSTPLMCTTANGTNVGGRRLNQC